MAVLRTAGTALPFGLAEAYEMPKPKGMWWRTYYRLQERAQAAERRAADDFIIAARRYLKMG